MNKKTVFNKHTCGLAAATSPHMGGLGGRFFLLFIVLLSTALHLSAQAVGTWQAHLSYKDITKTVYAGSHIYALASGGLYSYNSSDQSLQTYDKATNLNDCGISDIAWSTQEGRLIIIYDNYNIDIMDADGNVVNIADYMNKVMTSDKTINKTIVEGRYAYLATAFGVVRIDLRDGVVSDTYNIGKNILAVAVVASDIYAATSEGVYKTSLDGNPADKSQWQMLSRSVFSHLFYFNDMLVAAYNGGMGTLNTSSGTWEQFYTPWFTNIVMGGTDRLICYGGSHTYIIKSKTDRQDIALGFKAIAYSTADDTYWVSTSDGFLTNISIDDDGNETIRTSNLRPDSPDYNYFGFMKYVNNKLYTANGFYEPERTACIQIYDDNGNWTMIDHGIKRSNGQTYLSINALDIDPTDPTHMIAAAQTGLYEYKDNRLTNSWTMDNSPLQPAATVDEASAANYTIASAAAYTHDGTLWIANSYASSASLFALNGETWTSHHHSELMNPSGYSLGRMLNMIYDKQRGVLWMGSNDWRAGSLVCYNISTDEITLFDNKANQNGTAFTTDYVTDPTIDLEGNVWVATETGPYVVTASMIANGDNYFNQIIVPRNDGSGYGDYLLSGVSISAIAIDGANRKWFGTNGNGVYLISADNMTQLEHFTAANSPLLDDNIESIAINPNSGEVFFGTEKGLCSYMSGVTQSAEKMTKDSVYAYPNPVRPDYSGAITITGLTSDADVKIVTVNGTLVNEGRSTGGTYSWDGLDSNGRRVASGIYMVQTATSDGGKGTVCKIAIVN